MRGVIRRIFRDQPGDVRFAIVGIYVLLGVANIAVWIWAYAAFHAHPLLLGMALLAYGFGLRHAVDADHIAAIDNVVRKLMQENKRPVSVGFFFSLGHSTVVVLMAAAVAFFASELHGRFDAFKEVGGIIGTSVSAFFLLLVAVMNIFIMVGTCRTFHRVRSGGVYNEEDMDMILSRGGPLAHLFRPVFKLIRKSWHMYPLGFLFGLGFDTATEVALLAISATEASKGLPVWSVLVFPALFTAGMSLVDTTDGILMLGAYGWAFLNPLRKLFYNITITAVSVLVALLVGGIETLGLIGDQFAFAGKFWDAIRSLNDNFGNLGYLIIGIFAVCWLVSAVIYRAKGYDKLTVTASPVN
ncbi:MAG: HoxN/HupN/NixA family nickel/cobalt transporter [Chthoniobacteraceae bacterium]